MNSPLHSIPLLVGRHLGSCQCLFGSAKALQQGLHGLRFNHIISLVVSTHLKNISQNGFFPQVGVKIENIWNHHPVIFTVASLEVPQDLPIKKDTIFFSTPRKKNEKKTCENHPNWEAWSSGRSILWGENPSLLNETKRSWPKAADDFLPSIIRTSFTQCLEIQY